MEENNLRKCDVCGGVANFSSGFGKKIKVQKNKGEMDKIDPNLVGKPSNLKGGVRNWGV